MNLLKANMVCSSLVEMGRSPVFNFESKRPIRAGYMGFVIKLANLVKSVHDNEELNNLEGAKEVFNDNWVLFMAGELQSSNEKNSRSLGGKMKMFMEEDDSNFEVNMEKIMSRFNTFNSIVTASSGTDDDDEEKEEEEPDDEEPLTQLGTPMTVVKIEVVLPEANDIVYEYSEASFWRKVSHVEDSLEDLMADYE